MTKPKTNSDANGKTPKLKPRAKQEPKTSPTDAERRAPTSFPSPAWLWTVHKDGTTPGSPEAPTDPVSIGSPESSQDTKSQDTKTDAGNNDGKPNTPPTANQPDEQDTGDDTLGSAVPGGDMPAEWLELLNLARARDGESHKQCWERLRREARTAGMTRRDAISYAGRAVDLVWVAPALPEPPPPPEPEPEPEPVEIPAEPEAIPEPEAAIAADRPAADSLVFAVPESWGELPDNATLQAEIAWVSANRLRVRDGSGVDLSRAKTPAPSYSALSWLETSILFPSKFADISVKATANQDDEKEAIRREKASIDEVRAILAEMLED